MTEEKLHQYKQILIDSFKYFIDYLEENSIPYFAIAGTALGAKRHKGMIPWDDDVDVYVPRKDYERLLSLSRETINKDGYSIASIEDDGYYLPYAKFYNNKTTIWEVKQWPFIIGVWIDIFPLDYVSIPYNELTKKRDKVMRALYKYQRCVAENSASDFFNLLKGGHLHLAVDALYSFWYKRRNAAKYLTEFKERLSNLCDEDGPYCIALFGARGEKDFFPSAWFDSYRKEKFEHYEVRVPEPFEEYLTYVFGDYMKFPPESERVPKHDIYYCNLNQREQIEEVKAKMSR